MSYCTSQILSLASGIYQTIGSPSAQSIGLISGWITSSGAIGDINNRLNVGFWFSGDGPCIADPFGPDEASIYSLIYQAGYYQTAATNALANGGNILWVNMSEGDSKISRSDQVAVSKAYQSLLTNTQQSLYIAVNNWKRGNTIPTTVDASDLPSWPSP